MRISKTTEQRDFDIIAVGELNADLVLTGDVTPAFGQVEKLIDDAALTIGSSTAIFACGAARLGLRVAFVGKVGDDEFGRFMLRELQNRRVDTANVVVDPHLKTGLSVILSRGNDRAILTYSGSIAALTYADIDPQIIARGRHLHLGSFFLLDNLIPDVPRLFDLAQTSGLTTSMDTNYDPTEVWDSGVRNVLRHTDLFLPNETELHAIAGESTLSAALDVLGADIPTIAVKQGKAGGIGRHQGETVQADPLPVDVIDTTGAGDSFDAGFVYSYLAGWDLPAALRLACVCGALSTQAVGGTTAQPTLAEAQAFL